MVLWKVKYSPAVVMAAQTSFSIRVFEGVVRVLEGLIPEKARFTPMQAGLVLEAPVVFSVGSVTLCKKRERANVNSDYKAASNVCSKELAMY